MPRFLRVTHFWRQAVTAQLSLAGVEVRLSVPQVEQSPARAVRGSLSQPVKHSVKFGPGGDAQAESEVARRRTDFLA